ncbi:MAG: SpoIIE family protein phosphatase [Gemmatimonadetes bacterium]|nr:SpoIIE family protein phosphatase [Gemmatimonadota bacterium]
MINLVYVACGLAIIVSVENSIAERLIDLEELSDVVIDGDLSDWPGERDRIPLARVNGPMLVEENDFHGTYSVGYNSGKRTLYISVEVKDDDVVASSDTTEIFHGKSDKVGVIVGLPDLPGLSIYSNFGPKLLYRRGENMYLEEMDEERIIDKMWYGGHVAMAKLSGSYKYECSVEIDDVFPTTENIDVNSIFFGVGVLEYDENTDNNPTWFASSQMLDLNKPGQQHLPYYAWLQVGVPKAKSGDLKVEVLSDGASTNAVMPRVLIGNDKFTIKKSIDSRGPLSLSLPIDTYNVVFGQDSTQVTIKSGESVTVQFRATLETSNLGISITAGSGDREGRWRTWEVADGLPPASISSMKVDKNNILWMGTGRYRTDNESGVGLLRFDGASLVRYTKKDGLNGETVVALTESSDGNIWFSTWGEGVCHYDGKSFKCFDELDGLASNNVMDIAVDKLGNVWFATGETLCMYDGDAFKTFTADQGLDSKWIYDIEIDVDGNLWAASYEGIYRYNQGQFEAYLSGSEYEGEIIKVTRDHRGHVFLLTTEGIFRIEEGNFKLVYEHVNNELIQKMNPILSLSVDSLERVWISTFAYGLYCIDAKGIENFTTRDGLATDIVLELQSGENGEVWGSFMGGGIFRQDDNVYSWSTTKGLLHNQVFSAVEDPYGNLWLGARHGSGRFDVDKQDFSLIYDQFGMFHTDVRKRLCFLSRETIQSYDGKDWSVRGTIKLDGGRNSFLTAFAGDIQETYWVGDSSKGLFKCSGADCSNVEGLLSKSIGALALDHENNLWIGTRDDAGGQAGVSKYDGVEFDHFTVDDGLGAGDIRALHVDQKGKVWAGSWVGGLSYYDGEEWTTYTTADGLSHNRILSLSEDDDGLLWIGTWGGGVNLFDGRVFQRILKEDGLAHNCVQDVSCAVNGNTWIASEGGVTRYRRGKVKPVVRITEILSDHQHSDLSKVNLLTTNDFLRLSFIGSGPTVNSDRMLYLYRLAGYDDEWSQTRDQHIIYTDLPLGEYIFEVMAVDRDLNYSSTPAKVRVTVEAPKESILFWSSIALAAFGLCFATVYGMRKSRAQRRAEEAEAQAQEELLDRMQGELEAARQLQISLLPKQYPNHEQSEVAWYMKTATEVGGDYYDYLLAEDGTLTLTLGDATGHGMASGTLVSVAKSLFRTLSPQEDIAEILNAMSRSIGEMNMKRIYMAMNMIRLKDGKMRISSAGIPPVLLFRASSGDVEEIIVSGLPLGCAAQIAYKQQEYELSPGDTILMMSDGLPERNNQNGDEFGYERLEALFKEAGDQPPRKIVDYLIAGGERWAAGWPQDDDVTLIVVKVKSRR